MSAENAATDSDACGSLAIAAEAAPWLDQSKEGVGLMFKVTRWCVVPHALRKGVLVRGDVMQFHTREDALKARSTVAKRSARVDVYEVTGWPVQDLWDRPRKVS